MSGRELCNHRGFCNNPKEPDRGSSSRRVYIQLYQMILRGEVSHFSLVGRHLMEETHWSQREEVVRELQLAQVPKKTTCMHADDGYQQPHSLSLQRTHAWVQ